jgi:2-iminobutanoate/2-iminopropanoate deaminase
MTLKKEILKMDEGGRQFARLVRAGDFLFVAGTTGQDVIGAKGSIETQARRIFEKVKLILEQNSSSLENVLSMTTYLTSFDDLPKVSAIRNEFMHSAAAGTVIQVSELDGFAEVEIEFTALVS